MRTSTLLITLALLAPAGGWASGQIPLKPAREAFARAQALTDRDAGSLWGVSLSGPLAFVRSDDRAAVTNQAVPGFSREGDVWVGTLPDSIGIANTAFDWAGTVWTMVMWPLPESPTEQDRLIAHELWHHVQADLGLPSTGPANLHLDSYDGRYLLQLEGRALAAALRSSGVEQSDHLAAALAFRARRLEAFPGAQAEETALLQHEGLAQYTGLALALPREQRAAVAADDLKRFERAASFMRSFAYPFGQAYGVLLDDLLPDWRTVVESDLGLPDLLPVAPAPSDPGRYDPGDLTAREDSLFRARKETADRNRHRYADGPLLLLDFVRMNVQFDPGQVQVLDQIGSIYPGVTLTDEWGVLRAPGGALIRAPWCRPRWTLRRDRWSATATRWNWARAGY